MQSAETGIAARFQEALNNAKLSSTDLADLPEAAAPPSNGPASQASTKPANSLNDSLDTPEARSTLANKIVRAGNEATPEDIAAVRNHVIASDPTNALRLMDKYNVHVQVTRQSVVTEWPALKGTQPRGWLPGQMRAVPGIYDQRHHAAIIATQDGPDGSRRMPDNREEGSVDVVLHEGGHGIDAAASLWGNLSNQSKYIEAYKLDGNTAAFNGTYFHQNNDGPAGRSEAWAEGFALYNRNPSAMQQNQPHMFSYFRDFMASELPQAKQ